jgi:outer membrane protein OmpA-like peptidoglycan-associated protein
VLAVLLGGVGFALTRGDSDDSGDSGDASGAAATATTVDDTVAEGAAGADTATDTTAPASDASVAPTTVAPATTAAPATTTPADAAPATTATATSVAEQPAPEAAIDQPVRWAEFSGGKVYLAGTVPDQATADELRDKAGAVVGIDNVIVDYAIIAGAPRPPSAPLYVRDSVLFAKNSIDINNAARGVLDLGVVLMAQNPQVTIDIEGHTDSDGSEEMNLSLSQRRVDVIFDYLVSQGVDPARLTKAAYGEAEPIADNATSAGRAKNRRVEFQINNLLG